MIPRPCLLQLADFWSGFDESSTGPSVITDTLDGNIRNPGDLHGRVLSANEVRLTWDGNQICALVGPNLVEGVSGFGATVHDALRNLADNLIREGVWIEVTDRTEWHIDKISDE